MSSDGCEWRTPLAQRHLLTSLFSLRKQMGIGTILESKQIFLLATGENKAGIVRTMMEGPITSHVPASVLREHGTILCV